MEYRDMSLEDITMLDKTRQEKAAWKISYRCKEKWYFETFEHYGICSSVFLIILMSTRINLMNNFVFF